MDIGADADNEGERRLQETRMSDREGLGFDQMELDALRAVLIGAAPSAAVDALGRAGVWAHVLWRRRSGALAVLPA